MSDNRLTQYWDRNSKINIDIKPFIIRDPYYISPVWIVVFKHYKYGRTVHSYVTFRNACLGARELYNYHYAKIGESK